MRFIIENFQGTDADLLEILNAKTIKKINGDGMVTLAMVGNLSVELAAMVNYTLEMVLAAMPETDVAEIAQKQMLRRFLERFTVSDRGLDFANDVVRDQLTQVLTVGGIAAEQIDAVLSIGAYFVAPAQEALGREATQEDIDAERAIIAREQLQGRYSELFGLLIQPALQEGSKEDVIGALQQAAEAFE